MLPSEQELRQDPCVLEAGRKARCPRRPWNGSSENSQRTRRSGSASVSLRREALATIAGEVDSLTSVEREALCALDADLLDRFADALDPRIQRVRIPSGAGEGSRT